MLVISIASHDYVDYLRGMLASLYKNMPNLNASVWLINSDEKSEQSLKKVHKNCVVKHEKVQFKYNEQSRCYCVNRRADLFRIIRKSQAKGNLIEPILYLDADSLILQPLDELVEMSQKYDVVVCPRKETIDNKPVPEHQNKVMSRFLGAFTIVGSSLAADLFIKEYAKLVKTANWVDITRDHDASWDFWLRSQNALEECYVNLQDKVKFGFVPRKYCDTAMKPDSIIWAAKSNIKTNKKYLDKLDTFLC